MKMISMVIKSEDLKSIVFVSGTLGIRALGSALSFLGFFFAQKLHNAPGNFRARPIELNT
jgi:hypothetical protein